MTRLQGRGVVKGRASGRAMVTRMPVNFTAAYTKPRNLLPGRRAEIQDRHHELYGKNTRGKVLVLPACIGSTYTGLVLLELLFRKQAPAAVIVREADSLLVSGAVLGDTWFDAGIPVIEYPDEDLFGRIRTDDRVDVDGGTGEIVVHGS